MSQREKLVRDIELKTRTLSKVLRLVRQEVDEVKNLRGSIANCLHLANQFADLANGLAEDTKRLNSLGFYAMQPQPLKEAEPCAK